ncbi:MAG: Fic family protein [Bacilli bacterium]|nr:Fic family protein [Bacilli bacterium]
MDTYVPPFDITNEMIAHVSSITEKLGSISSFKNLSKFPSLRKTSRVKSIQSSCAIEANSLSLGQVEDVINGRAVIGPSKDIAEIKNAVAAYEKAFQENPFLESSLKSIHALMTDGLDKTPGRYRTGGEGVIDGDGNVVFVAPPGKMVPGLMSELFRWTKDNFAIVNPLILSSVFHYEFVFIHPFGDGNGRMARLWQNVLLSQWRPIFEYIPIESLIKNHQNEYYEAISASHRLGKSTPFVVFMLKMIDLSVAELAAEASLCADNANAFVAKMLRLMAKGKWYSAKEIQRMMRLSDRANFRKNYLDPALEMGLVIPEFPDKKTSKLQRYKRV